MNGSIAITGAGIVSAAGIGCDAAAAALAAGRSFLGHLRRFASPRCGALPVGEVVELDVAAGASRVVALARTAASEALASAGLPPVLGTRGDGTALVLGTCVGGMPESEVALARERSGAPVDPGVWLRHECGAATAAVARAIGARGPRLTVSTACSSGAQAIALAGELLAAGECELALAGGADALCALTLNGFASLLALDPAGCRPFDRERRGTSLGEGAAFLALEREDSARARGAPVLARLLGSANTCDAYHPTAPDPEGAGALRALQRALAAAGREPADVDYVNAHGTGTVENDRAEGRALAALFRERAPPISSTKGTFGHALGAAGAIEAVVAVLALTRGFLPGTAGFTAADPECRIEPLREFLRGRPRLTLSNSFGFGGNNTVLCLGAAEPGP